MSEFTSQGHTGGIVTLETCDRCGPFVAAAVAINYPNDTRLTFCAHCINYGAAASLAAYAVPLDSLYPAQTDAPTLAVPANV